MHRDRGPGATTVVRLALTLFLLFPGVALAQQDGLVLEGRIANGTQGGGTVGGLTVVLQGLLPDGQEALRMETQTMPDGSFRLTGVVPQDGHLYRPVVEYAEVRYYGDGHIAQDLMGSLLDITVYEAIEIDGAVRIAQQTTVVVEADSESGVLHLLESTTVENTGDRTYIGARDFEGNLATVRLPLPFQAFDIVPGLGFGGQGYKVAEGYLVDSAPLPPGQREMLYSYSVAYTAAQHPLSRIYPYPTGAVRLLVPVGSLTAQPMGMDYGERVEVGEQLYDSYVARNVGVGSEVGLLLSALPVSQGVQSQNLEGVLRLAATGAAAAALVGIIAYAYARRRRVQAVATTSGTRREEMVQRLATLEEEYRTGTLAEEEYRRRRAAERLRLREMLEAPSQERAT